MANESKSLLSPSKVVCAANRMTMVKDGVETTHVIAGARHHDGVMNPIIKALCENDADRITEMKQGFIDQHNKFLTRHEAWVIAERNNQIFRRVGGDGPDRSGLFSENLY